jgi:hypothetical protein
VAIGGSFPVLVEHLLAAGFVGGEFGLGVLPLPAAEFGDGGLLGGYAGGGGVVGGLGFGEAVGGRVEFPAGGGGLPAALGGCLPDVVEVVLGGGERGAGVAGAARPSGSAHRLPPAVRPPGIPRPDVFNRGWARRNPSRLGPGGAVPLPTPIR